MLLRSWILFALLVSGAAYLPAAVLYNVTDLGGGTYAYGINNAGQITGEAGLGSSPYAFLYSNGVRTSLGTLPVSVGYGINNAGQIAGSQLAGGPNQAFLYSNGVVTDLGPAFYCSVGYGINNAGQVTGVSQTASGAFHAFLYSNGVMTDLGTLGGTYSAGNAINNAGQITGFFSTASGVQHAFIYSSGVMVDLNSLIDPSLQITLSEATGINDLGQIVVNMDYGSIDSRHAYLLTPVPEPGTWMLFGAGLLLVGALARSWGRANGADRCAVLRKS